MKRFIEIFILILAPVFLGACILNSNVENFHAQNRETAIVEPHTKPSGAQPRGRNFSLKSTPSPRILLIYYPLQYSTSYRSALINDLGEDVSILHKLDKAFLNFIEELRQKKIYSKIFVRFSESDKGFADIRKKDIRKFLFRDKVFYDSPDCFWSSESFRHDYIRYIQNTKAFIDVIYFDSVSSTTSIINKFRSFRDSTICLVNFVKPGRCRFSQNRLRKHLDRFQHIKIYTDRLGRRSVNLFDSEKIGNFFDTCFRNQTRQAGIAALFRNRKPPENKPVTPGEKWLAALKPNKQKPSDRRYQIGMSVRRRPLECHILGQGKEVIFVMASVHGNEVAGTPLVRLMIRHLEQNPGLLSGRKVIVLPVANPDGVRGKSRLNIRGVDLNRNFPAANRRNTRQYGFSPLSEPETRAIMEIIRHHRPSRIISLHQPFGCIDYDGPGERLAEHIAGQCDLPVRKLGALPGSLGSYAGMHLGIPTITFELPGGAEKLSYKRLWERYGNALMAFVMWSGEHELTRDSSW